MEPCALRQEKSCEKCCSSIRYHISCHSAFNPIIIYYTLFNFTVWSQCLKITGKVAFKIASEASYVYILSGQKFIKNVKNWCKMPKFKIKWDILGWFLNTVIIWNHFSIQKFNQCKSGILREILRVLSDIIWGMDSIDAGLLGFLVNNILLLLRSSYL